MARLLSFIFLMLYYFNNFVVLYIILETIEFLLTGLLCFFFPHLHLSFTVLSAVLYVLIAISVICFVVLIRVFAASGKNRFNGYF